MDRPYFPAVVRSTISAPAALFCTEAMPFFAPSLDS